MNRVRFLNISAKLDGGREDWNAPSHSKLWLYNLHYFDGLLASQTQRSVRLAWLERWLRENEPGHGNGWEPYPLSLRIVNWIKWHLQEEALAPCALHSLALQCRFLSDSLEYHLLGNHLWANAKALFLAGCFFGNAEGDSWCSAGYRLLREQIGKQFLKDGGHFERSTGYQAIVTEDLLDLLNLTPASDSAFIAELRNLASSALRWLCVMTRPDGRRPLFNDASHDMGASTDALLAYADRLGLAVPSIACGPAYLTPLEATGFARWDGNEWSAWWDFGPLGPDYIPGHGHADCFTFELYGATGPIVVDTGVSTYDTCARRAYERGTAAHNTVEVAGCDQAELWGSFRTGRRPKVTAQFTDSAIEGVHDGYRALGFRHRRRVSFENDRMRIEDRLLGRGSVTAKARFHLSPGGRPVLEGNIVRAGAARFEFTGADNVAVTKTEIAEEFNRLQPSFSIVTDFSDELVTTIFPNG